MWERHLRQYTNRNKHAFIHNWTQTNLKPEGHK